jgi:hypothetical protein
MSSAASLKTHCPICNKAYVVPASAAGHKARCTECQTVFRVTSDAPSSALPPPTYSSEPTQALPSRLSNGGTLDAVAPRSPSPSNGKGLDSVLSHPATDGNGQRPPQPPTEEDIVRWLCEANEEDSDATPAPRVVRASAPPPSRRGTMIGQRIVTPTPNIPASASSGSGAPVPQSAPPAAKPTTGSTQAKPSDSAAAPIRRIA